MKTLYYIFFVLFCCSCRNNASKQQGVTIINEESVEKVRVDEMRFDNLLCINKAHIMDSLLLLIDRCDTCIFHVYNMNQDSIISSFGQNGQGPDDFIYPLFLNNVNGMDSITCYDTGLKTLKIMDKNECISSHSVKIVSRSMPPQLLSSPDLSQERFGYIGCTDTGGEGLYFKYMESEDTLIWVNYPPSIQDLKGIAGNGSRITCNDSMQRVAISMRYYNRLFLYDCDGNILREVQMGKDEITPQIDFKHKHVKRESILCSFDIQSTDSYIYVLSFYQPEMDVHKPDLTSKIFVFDWDLNYIKTYLLPHKAHSMDIDKNANKLIYIGNDKSEECVIGIILLSEDCGLEKRKSRNL